MCNAWRGKRRIDLTYKYSLLNTEGWKQYICFLPKVRKKVEALAVVDILRRAGVETRIVSVTGDKMVTGAHGIRVEADMLMEEVDFSKAAMLVLPGGLPGSYNLAGHEGLAEGIMRQYKAGKPLAAICAAPLVYGRMGLLKGLKATCYPGFEEELGRSFLIQVILWRRTVCSLPEKGRLPYLNSVMPSWPSWPVRTRRKL